MKRVLFLTLAAVMIAVSASAIPAKKQFTATQPDGSTITVNGYGDEWSGYFTTTDGYTISGKSDGYFYYVMPNNAGQIVVSDVRANDPNRRSVTERKAISGLKTHIHSPMSAEMQAMQREVAMLREQMVEQRFAQAQNSPETRVALGEARVLVILANYTDVKWSSANASMITNVFNQTNYNGTGSAKDYYVDNSNGQYNPTFDIVGPVQLPSNRFYYGEEVKDAYGNVISHDRDPYQMIIDACNAADPQVNFADYAVNSQIPMVIVLFAGKGQADGGASETIWPHKSNINRYYDGVRVSTYFTSPELDGSSGGITGIGVICHEFGHSLGLPDWYDTDGANNGEAYGLGVLSLMDGGSYLFDSSTPPALNVVERWILGWIDEIPEITESGSYTLAPTNINHGGYIITTRNTNEFFAIEYRDGRQSKWDRILRENYGNYATGGANPGRGLLIYHYDKSLNRIQGNTAQQLWNANRINAFSEHECFKLMMAQKITGYTNLGRVFFPGSGNVSSFAAYSWANDYAGGISNMVIEGDNIRFTAAVPDASNDPRIRNIVATPNQFDITVTWDGIQTGTWKVEWRALGGTSYLEQTVTQKIANIPKLNQNTTYEIVITDVLAVTQGEASAKTERIDRDKLPSLNAMKGSYTTTEPIILSVVNLNSTPRSIEWSLNGTATNNTCQFLTAGKYTIEAKITNADSSVEYLTRVINVTNQ